MGNFTDKDKGWNRLMTTFKVNAGETAGFAGYLRSSGEYKNEETRKAEAKASGKPMKPAAPVSVAQVAAFNEYGTASAPERPFVRTAMAEHTKEMKRLTKKAAAQVVDGKMGKSQAIGLLCQKVIDWIAQSIDSNVPPPNAPSTVAAKGSSHTLIDTGQMKNSLDWEIRGNKK